MIEMASAAFLVGSMKCSMPEVLALGVLAHHHQIDLLVAGVQAGERASGADVGVKVELLTQRDVHAAVAAADGGRQRPLQADAVLANRGQRYLGERRSVHRDRACTGVHRLPADARRPWPRWRRTAASTTSGPIPSPRSSVTVEAYRVPTDVGSSRLQVQDVTPCAWNREVPSTLCANSHMDRDERRRLTSLGRMGRLPRYSFVGSARASRSSRVTRGR